MVYYYFCILLETHTKHNQLRMMLKLLFWILLFLVFYAYIGYGILLYIMVIAKRILGKKSVSEATIEPTVTMFVAAYNEKDFIAEKVSNSLQLDYPAEKVTHLWVTDGSTDGTPELLKKYPQINVSHLSKRSGKIGAINRGMLEVKTPFVIFSDANTLLSTNAIREIVAKFAHSNVGCVTGEKKIKNKGKDAASGSGEGLYWKYESMLKKLDGELNSTVGAVGELFAIRTQLFRPTEADTILDDFMISIRIAMSGYKIAYTPNAYAVETASANIREEMKRKIRIAAGSVQSVIRLKNLLNIFRYGMLSFQYISHKVIRWFVPPFALPLLLIINTIIVFTQEMGDSNLFEMLLFAQLIFYLIAALGWFFENTKTTLKLFFVPYYISMINIAVILGVVRYFRGKQPASWERAARGN